MFWVSNVYVICDLLLFIECKLDLNCSIVMQVAGDLLKQYKEKFRGGTFAVTWNYLRESMNTYLSQPNPVTARWESEEHLRDPKFQLDAFRVSVIFVFWFQISCFCYKINLFYVQYNISFFQYRTSRLLQSVAVRLRKHAKTLGSFGAWNRCLNHLLTLAESHIESVILEKFIEDVQKYFPLLDSQVHVLFALWFVIFDY